MTMTGKTPRKILPAGIAKVLKRLHYPLDVILLCVRWYVSYSLSLRNLKEMMAERVVEVDHSTVHRGEKLEDELARPMFLIATQP